MKTATSLSTTHLGKIMLACAIFLSAVSTAQTTIVNYNFDVSSVTDYPKFYDRAVNGISSVLSSADAYDQNLHFGTGSFAGTATGGSAFDANTITSPNRIVAFKGSGSKYLNFRISGSSIMAYNTFQIYFQARRLSNPSTINTIQYSVDGGAFTTFSSPSFALTGSWTEFQYNLPSVAPTSTLDIRINFTNGSGSSVFGMDNFQVQANGPSSTGVAIDDMHPIAGNIFQNTTTDVIAGFRMDAHVSTVTPSSITLKTGGTYLTTDFVNFILWQNDKNSIYGATQVGVTIPVSASGVPLVFNTGFSSISANTSSYFFLTADATTLAVASRTISATSTSFTNIAFSGTVTKIGVNPVPAGNTQTIAANAGSIVSNINKYTSTSVSGLWNNGGSVSRWSNVSGGPYTTQQWVPGAIANLQGTGGTIQTDATSGAVVKQINATVNSYNIQATSTQVTTGITLQNPGIIDVSASNVMRMSNSAGGNGNANPLLTSTGFIKQGTGELMFSQPFSIYGIGVQGPIYINGGTLTVGDKSNTNNPNLYIYDNDFFINNGKFTIAASSSTYASLGFIRSITVDGSGSNTAAMELYNTGSSAPVYAELTTDDRYPQLAIDLVPLTIKGTLTTGYAGNTTGTSSAFVFGNVNMTGNTTFKTLTNGSGNLASSSGIITNIELAGEGQRSGLSATPALGNMGVTDNGNALIVQGGGTATSDGGYVSINDHFGTSTGAWQVGNSDGSQAGYLSINDPDGLTTGSITVNQNSQLDINVTGSSVSVIKTPAITLNGAKTYSYYGSLALYNSTSGTTSSTISTPVIVNTADATTAIYNDNWTMAGSITGTGGFQLYGSSSSYDLSLTSASNTWSGGTKLLSGILNVSSGSAISTGALTMAQLSGFDTRLNLDNAAQTVNSLSSAWVNTTGTRTQVINLGTNHILTVNQSSATTFGDGAVNTLTAYISGPGNLIKDGSGTLTLTGLNTYSGLTQVKGGSLELNRTNTGMCLPVTNNVDIIGGTLRVMRNQALNNVTLSTGTLTVETGITLTINGTFYLVNGNINLVGTGAIAYGPSGRLVYAGSSFQTTSSSEIPLSNGPKAITNDNQTGNGVILSSNITNLSGNSINNGWLDFNGKTLTGTGSFTSNGLTGPYPFTGTTSTASKVVTSVSSTAGLGLGMKLISAGLPASTFIVYIDPLVPNTITLNNNPSTTSGGVSFIAGWRGGLKISMPNGIGDGTTNSHVQLTGANVYNSGVNYVFNTPTSGTTIYPAYPTAGTLSYSPAYNVTIQAGVSNKVILGASQDIEIANDLTLTSGIFVTNNNLVTWDNSGGALTSPNTPFATLTTAANNSYIATCTNTGTELTPTTPFDGLKGFQIKNIGSGTDVYFPVGLDFSSANRMMLNNTGTTSNFTVLLKSGDLAQTPGARVNRIWHVKASASSGVKAGMRLFFTKRDWSTWPSPESEVEGGFLYSDIHLIQKDYNESFVNRATSSDITNFNSATYNNTEIYGQYTIGVSPDYNGATNGINTYTRFSLINGFVILPVTVTNLQAYRAAGSIKVDWVALNEVNTGHYEVEKSLNGVTFTMLGTTQALNNGNPQNKYSLTDLQPAAGNNYYRIKIIAKDAKVTYTSVVSVNMAYSKPAVAIQPNPVHNKAANLVLSNLAAGTYGLFLYNSLGQQVYSSSITHNGGSAIQQLLLPAFIKPGTYILKLLGANAGFTVRIVAD